MISAVVSWSLRNRALTIALTLLFAAGASLLSARLRLDALPDITSNQVIVLTRADGLTPEEVELRVTRPVESALGGLPGVESQRSISRYGLSSVTVVFSDEVDPYRARQVVGERMTGIVASLPDGADPPELAPLTGGLGEVFHFTLSSPGHTSAELFEMAELRVAPLLRTVPGVVEVNSWGGERRTWDVVARPDAMAQRGLSLDDLKVALSDGIGSVAGASVSAGDGHVLLRGQARPQTAAEIASRVLRFAPLVRVGDVADVVEGAESRIGAATADGRGEVVYVMVQMLRDANALEVTRALQARMPAVDRVLPEGVLVQIVYDRADLVSATMRTVASNLLEGGLLVVVILLTMLGNLRAGMIVAVVIPLSMVGATFGMVVLGGPGNLMSLGALDFGLLVDGAVVMVEAVFHTLQSQKQNGPLSTGERRIALETAIVKVARPVFFSVLVILLVYVPILTLTDVDGKMFRPMAITLIMALATSLVLALTFVPAAISLLIRDRDIPERDPLLVRWMSRLYQPILLNALRRARWVVFAAVLMLIGGGVLLVRAGTTFVPQLDEGDLVVQTTRDPDIGIEAAVRRAGQMEAALLKIPEVRQVVSRIGSPAVATDIMGLEQADVFVGLHAPAQWRPGLDRAALIQQMDAVLAVHDPGSDPAFTQPIQMRFNELLAGAVSDVAISIYGDDLGVLQRLAEATRKALANLPGAQDVQILNPPDVSMLEVVPRAFEAGRQQMTTAHVLDVIQAVRTGVDVGTTFDGATQIPIRLRLAGDVSARTLPQLQVPTPLGTLVPLEAIANIERRETPALINHDNAQRRIIVGFNVRGRDLGPVVADARIALEAVQMPAGYRQEWGGQSEALDAATRRMAMILPAVVLGILLLLVMVFRRVAPALLIFLNVPFAGVGGIAALVVRDMPVSISAAVGFIALSGIAVLNGVVLMTRVLEVFKATGSRLQAARIAAQERLRPVMMTALVAGLGFLPMMLASGPGAEVQRPLATVVVGGLISSTLLTLIVLPALYSLFARQGEESPDPG